MQPIKLKAGFESVLNPNVLSKIKEENEFIYLNGDVLEISYNLDKSDMYASPFGEEEDDFERFIRNFEKSFNTLKDFFTDDFEIVYFTYTDEYTVTMWKFEGNKLRKGFGWIGDFCDEDDIDNVYSELKQGYPTDELLNGLRKVLN